nr:MAG TPA: hypothetical protein [Bacteriophage sp.]
MFVSAYTLNHKLATLNLRSNMIRYICLIY